MRSTGTRPHAQVCRARAFCSSVLVGLAALALPGADSLAAKGGIPGPPGGNSPNVSTGSLTCSIANLDPITAGTPVTFTGTVNGGKSPYTVTWTFQDGSPGSVTTSDVQPGDTTADTTFVKSGQKTVTLSATDSSNGKNAKTCSAQSTVTVNPNPPVARGDTYGTPVGKTLHITASRVSGVLYNDFYVDPATGKKVFNSGLTAGNLDTTDTKGDVILDPTGGFTYTPAADAKDNENDSFTYQAKNANGTPSNVATVNIHIQSDQPDFKILMNYELGMHCTGFEFSYCCILPPYNSIVAQVVKPQQAGNLVSNADYPRLLQADPDNGLDPVGRPTVLRDYDDAGGFQKYVLEYYHDAMPRLEHNMPGTFHATEPTDNADGPNNDATLISAAEGNSLLYYTTPFDSACTNPAGTGDPTKGECDENNPNFAVGGLVFGPMDGIPGKVRQGNGRWDDPTDNFANGWMNHLYIYVNSEGNPNLDGENGTGGSLEKDKIRLGVTGMLAYPHDCGAALQPLGPVAKNSPLDFNDTSTYRNDCSGLSNGDLLTFTGSTGTVVYTQSNVLENVPITLTSPQIWEALGLALTPFEDSINFFGLPGAVDEDSIRPFVAMKARLHDYDPNVTDIPVGMGPPVLGSNGLPVIGFGTAPIDIPNCERCHGVRAVDPSTNQANVNSPNWVRRQSGPDPFYGYGGESLEYLTNEEITYWKAVYPSLSTMQDWYARLKGAAVNMMAMHDFDVGTDFTACYPADQHPECTPLDQPSDQADIPQDTRFGHQAVICQTCHGDNVIAVLKSAVAGIHPISEDIHDAHKVRSAQGPITFDDSLGRFGGCQGCHPAHRSDGVMDKYPITGGNYNSGGDNANANGDNRLGKGGCFVGRDVHSNPMKDQELHGGFPPVGTPGYEGETGTGTAVHLTAVGRWLSENVFRNQAGRGNVAGEDTRGIWCTNCHTQLSQAIWAAEDCDDLIHSNDPNTPCKVNPRAATSLTQLAGQVGLSYQKLLNYIDPKNPATQDPVLVAAGFGVTLDETHAPWNPAIADAGIATIEVDASGQPVLTPDGDTPPDYSVNILSFCTTADCVNLINLNKSDKSKWRYPVNAFLHPDVDKGMAVPFSAAAAGRDHWLAAGEPHCGDCHAAPYTEPSGNKDFFLPFNYPAKASLDRYSFGHQGISCQGCHESIHGLYPVGAAIDNTSYAQAAALNGDGSHGPLKCGTCHQTYNDANGNGAPLWINTTGNWGSQYVDDFDAAVGFAHEFTATDGPLVLSTTCLNCHADNSAQITATNVKYLTHSVSSDAFDISGGKQDQSARTSRRMMDTAEIATLGHLLGAAENADGTANPDEATERTGLCSTCHTNGTNQLGKVSCTTTWKQHLTNGMVTESVWEDITKTVAADLCGW